MDFLFQSYWDWLPNEIQEYIVSLAWRQHMKDLKSNQPLFNLLLREMHDHHTLTTAMNEGLDENNRGRIIYHHKYFINCPDHISTDRNGYYNFGYSYICFGKNCHYNHSRIYFEHVCGKLYLLGHSFRHVRLQLPQLKLMVSSHRCGYW